MGRRSGIEAANDLDYETLCKYSDLGELGYMSNIDKHRRLALTAWRPDMVWWGSDGESNRRWLPGGGTFEDGSIIGYIVETFSRPRTAAAPARMDGEPVPAVRRGVCRRPARCAYAVSTARRPGPATATIGDVVMCFRGWSATTKLSRSTGNRFAGLEPDSTLV